MTDSSEFERWLDQARGGDERAQDAVIERCRAPLVAHIQRRLGSHLRRDVDVSDVEQDTFVQAIRSLPNCRAHDEASFLRWLRGISEHVILNVARRQRGDKLLFVDHDTPTREARPSQALRREERLERLRLSLEDLAPDYRTAVQLVRIEGLPIREAAERMNRTPNSVMHLLRRALEKLRESYSETESFGLPPEGFEGRNDDG